jgi:hypothetical protein
MAQKQGWIPTRKQRMTVFMLYTASSEKHQTGLAGSS